MLHEDDDARWTVELAEEFAVEGRDPLSTHALLYAIAEQAGVAIDSPAALFDSIAVDEAQEAHEAFEILARPGDPIPQDIRTGDLWIRRALGEGRLAHMAVVAAPEVHGHEQVEHRGLRAESLSEGSYLQVVEAGPFPHSRAERFARRISQDAEHVARDSVLLRLRGSIPSPLVETTTDASLSLTPTPGRFYQIRRGNTLLGITGRAYGAPSGPTRLQLARFVNDHPFNRRLRRAKPVKLFPEGIISFFPRFASASAQLAARDGTPPRGSQFAVIFIPLRETPMGGLTVTIEGRNEAPAGEQAVASTISFNLRIGQRKRVRATARRLPVGSYTWTSADPAIASVAQLGTPQTHPNRARIRALAAGTTTVDIRYVARDGHVSTGTVTLVITAPPPPVERGTVEQALRRETIARATRRDTFLTEAAVTAAIDGRAARAEFQTLFDELVGALVAQHAADPALVPAIRTRSAARLVGFLEDDAFRCASDGNRIVVHRDVIDGMKLAWTRSRESQSVAGAACRVAPGRCPAAHQPLHVSGDASHFMNLSESGIRVIELAGLFGADLRALATRRARVGHSVKLLAPNAPLANLSVVGIRQGANRELHVARQAPRQVASVVDGAPWRNVGFGAVPGTDYHVFKRRYFEASLHRQWGRETVVQWLVGLTNFYRDRTNEVVGIGDVSHIVGEVMTDHGSHRLGRDVDIYALEAPLADSTFPRSHWATASDGTVQFRELIAPAADAARPEYGRPRAGTAVLAGARATRVQELWVTLLAYCAATHTQLNRVVWHGASRLRAEAVAAAERAWDETLAAGQGTPTRAGWRESWGPGPADRAAITAAAGRFVGDGSAARTYGARTPGCNPSPSTPDCPAWPLHQDHIHVRFR